MRSLTRSNSLLLSSPCSFLIFLYLFTAPCSLLPCLDFSIRPKGFVFIPMGSGNIAPDGNKMYSVGGGGELGFEIDLASVWPNPQNISYTLGLEGAMLVSPMFGNDLENVSFYSGSAMLGLHFFPLSRLFFRVDGAAGIYLAARNSGNNPGRSTPGFFWRSGAELGFRFTPSLTLSANMGWRQFRNKGDELNSSIMAASSIRNGGINAGLTAHISFHGRRNSKRISVGATLDQYDEVYPAFMQLYQTNPIGSVTLRNNENAEIRNVRVSFRASDYTASEYPCGSVSIIPRGNNAELPLYADFSPEILRFTDTGRIVGELVIRYSFLGQERETVQAITVSTHNRNTVTDDPAALAAFISPTSPETLDFARFIAGFSRANNRIIGHNKNMQYAIWFLEGLYASNFKFGETYTKDNEAQFPAETLAFRSGTSRDLALLFAAGLEGVGISSAFIRTEKEFLVAVSLGIEQNAAETLFNGTDKLLIINNEVWLPLSMSAFNSGFIACWNQGVRTLNKIFSEDTEADFIIVKEAWSSYPPALLPEIGKGDIRTDNEVLKNRVNLAMQRYINNEINSMIQQLLETRDNTAKSRNRLGILFTRAGRIDEGKAAYERAASMGSVPAMTNRGNLALIEGDYAEAEYWFIRAIIADSENKTALRGLERIAGAR